MSNNQKSGATHGSTNSSQDASGNKSAATKPTWFQKKIDDLTVDVEQYKILLADEREKVAALESRLEDSIGLKSQLDAKETALRQKLGNESGEMGALPDVAWLLLAAEYAHRTKQWQFVGPESRRRKTDRYGSEWSIKAVADLSEFSGLVESLGYGEDAHKDDFIILHCFPNKGPYDIACVEIEKANAMLAQAQRAHNEAKRAVAQAKERNRPDLAEKAQREADVLKAQVDELTDKKAQCSAVIENAIQRFYMIPVESFERMDMYGLPVECQTATVVPQKKHLAAA